MSIRMQIRNDEPLSEGSYEAVLKKIEQKQTSFGERLMWSFDIPEHGAEVVGFTSLSPSTLAKTYAWAVSLNPTVASQKSWSTEDVVGKECVLILELTEDQKGRKKNRISRVKPAAEAGEG